ncbi:MAG: hypothetical protein FJ361_02745 [Gemmatimonadetes bacterium]|nr:hypothetical protein [Gemmatimonadota bacterium]
MSRLMPRLVPALRSRVVVGSLLALSMWPRATVAQASGSYLALKIDQSPLPLADRVTDGDGTTYLIEFDRMVLSLRAESRFRAIVRFRRTLTSAAGQARGGGRAAPLQTMTVTGRYAVTGRAIRFTPDASDETRGLRILDGTVESRTRIAVPFDYRNGRVTRNRTLRLELRTDIL